MFSTFISWFEFRKNTKGPSGPYAIKAPEELLTPLSLRAAETSTTPPLLHTAKEPHHPICFLKLEKNY